MRMGFSFPLSSSATAANSSPPLASHPYRTSIRNTTLHLRSFSSYPYIRKYSSALAVVYRSVQAVELFPSVHVRDIRLGDYWDVAETHCSSFFPNYTFPLDLLLRINRFIGLFWGFSVPPGCMRTCLVAITDDEDLYFGSGNSKLGSFDGKLRFSHGSLVGILTVDTVADFLPRKGPLQQRRTGIAYIANVAVRKTHRRKGIAKRLVAKAEARALSWGCRAIALHCDSNDMAATCLYLSQGFKCIKVPEHANWPRPRAPPGTQFSFMMKLLHHDPCEGM